MLSLPDMAILGAAALLLFGPEQLPKVVRKVGAFTREIQNTSQSFIREMERAAEPEPSASVPDPYAHTYDPTPYDATSHESATYEPAPYEPPAEPAEYVAPPRDESYEPPEPPPIAPRGAKRADPPPAAAPAVDAPAAAHADVSEKLAEPRGALEPWDAPTQAFSAADVSAAKAAPEDDHPVHI